MPIPRRLHSSRQVSRTKRVSCLRRDNVKELPWTTTRCAPRSPTCCCGSSRAWCCTATRWPAASGLGPSDSQFLGLLRLEGPLTPGRLAELTGLTTGSVTGVLDRLERGGFVRRERDAADRRKVLVTPVPEAVARLAAHYAEHGAHTDALLGRRDTAELQVVADFLARPDRLAGRDGQRRAALTGTSTGRRCAGITTGGARRAGRAGPRPGDRGCAGASAPSPGPASGHARTPCPHVSTRHRQWSRASLHAWSAPHRAAVPHRDGGQGHRRAARAGRRHHPAARVAGRGAEGRSRPSSTRDLLGPPDGSLTRHFVAGTAEFASGDRTFAVALPAAARRAQDRRWSSRCCGTGCPPTRSPSSCSALFVVYELYRATQTGSVLAAGARGRRRRGDRPRGAGVPGAAPCAKRLRADRSRDHLTPSLDVVVTIDDTQPIARVRHAGGAAVLRVAVVGLVLLLGSCGPGRRGGALRAGQRPRGREARRVGPRQRPRRPRHLAGRPASYAADQPAVGGTPPGGIPAASGVEQPAPATFGGGDHPARPAHRRHAAAR